METITITINGREVSGHAGMTILELARESGVDIPTLCHDDKLSPIGACRICLVENEQTGALMSSCVTPIAPGMIINTDSDRVIEHRKTIVNLMLASHPDSCMMCDKGNRCQLRQIAADMGIGLVELQRLPQMVAIQELNPFIERDLSKCILCGKCIRACQELVVEGAIDYFQRGFIARPATFGDLPLEASECTFCGTCLAMCPTGALMEKERSYHGTTDKAVETTCPYCGCGCTIRLEVKGDQIVRSTPGKNGGINQGTLCVRGGYGYDFVHSTDRLKSPMIRKPEGLEEASWENALAMAAEELKGIQSEYGPDSLAVIGSPRCTNEENYILQRFARCVLGTNNIANSGQLYSSRSEEVQGLYQTEGIFDAMAQSDVIIVAGADLSTSAPILEYAIKRAVRYKDSRLIVVDPSHTGLTPFAQIWLRPKVDTDISLINSISRVILDEGMYDRDFIESEIVNFEEQIKSLDGYSPEDTEATTGVPAENVKAVARSYANGNKAVIIFGSGITRYSSKTKVQRALMNLAILTGNTSDSKARIYPIMKDSNTRGADEMGVLPDFLPGYGSLLDSGARERFEERWGVKLPSKPGFNLTEIVEQINKGEIRGLYVVGEDPASSLPDSDNVIEALAKLESLIVQDIFLSKTAEMASVILPASSFAEKEGTFTSFDGRKTNIRKVIEPVGESLPDWEITLQLAEKMGHPMSSSSFHQIINEIEELVPLSQSNTDMGFQANRQDKPLAFHPVEDTTSKDDDIKDYPLTLIIGNNMFHQGTGSRSSRASRLAQFSPQSFLEIGRNDAQKFSISDGDRVRVVSPNGNIPTTVRITDRLLEGTVSMPVAPQDEPLSKLFVTDLDTETNKPAIKPCHVRVEKVVSHE